MTRLASFVAALFLASCSFGGGPTIQEHKAIEMDRSESTRLDLKIGAGELKVGGGAAKKLEADFAYTEALKPTLDSRTSGGTNEITISQAGGGLSFGNNTSRWDVRLNDRVPVEVVAKLGAGQADMTLGSLNLRGVNMDIGVGEVNVDLRGAPKQSYDVRINGAASARPRCFCRAPSASLPTPRAASAKSTSKVSRSAANAGSTRATKTTRCRSRSTPEAA